MIKITKTLITPLLFFGLLIINGHEKQTVQAADTQVANVQAADAQNTAETEEVVKPPRRSSSWYTKYNKVRGFDQYFIEYSRKYFGPDFDWRYFKAQAIAESNLEVDAQSPSGARGLMQIMPATWDEIQKRNPHITGSTNDAQWNIAAGIWYNHHIWRRWLPKRTHQDRINFMMASFNAGRLNIVKAQRLAAKRGLDKHEWKSIEITLPEVTGRRSRQTIAYVRKINRIVQVLNPESDFDLDHTERAGRVEEPIPHPASPAGRFQGQLLISSNIGSAKSSTEGS